jgi:hypothetical protein
VERISERMFSGRIWARPNCQRPCNIQSCGNPKNEPVKCTFKNGSRTPDCVRDGLWCDSGNCPGGNETTCRGEVGQFIGGLPPGPLLELTLCGGRGAQIACYKDGPAYDPAACDRLPTADYYDISNVDGTSKIWAGMEVSRGRRLTGPGAPQGRFNCGAAMMPGQFDLSLCPQPLRIFRNDSSPRGYSPNATLEQAIGCLSACNFMSQVAWSAPGQPQTEWFADRTQSQSLMETASQEAVSRVTTEDVSRTCCECGHLGDRGSCPAPRVEADGKVRGPPPAPLPPRRGAAMRRGRSHLALRPPAHLVLACPLSVQVIWPPNNAACIAGCSPYANYPAEYASAMCKLEFMPSIQTGTGGSIPLGEVQGLFKKWSPQAYSWQFDDLSSTYMCESSDFKLTFCPRTKGGGRGADARSDAHH